MERFVIKGGVALNGEVEIGGAKNAALGLLAAAIMTDEDVTIENLPDVSDINQLIDAIANIGATVNRIDRHTVTINGKTIRTHVVEYEQMRKIRASYYLLGALWASLTRQRLLFRVDAQSVADLLTCILRDLELWEQMLLLIMVWLMLRRNV